MGSKKDEEIRAEKIRSGPPGPSLEDAPAGYRQPCGADTPGLKHIASPGQKQIYAQPVPPAQPVYPVGYLTIHGAAQYASVSAKTVTRWIRSGLPVHQGTTRGKVLIRPIDIDAYLTRRQAPVVNLNLLVDDVLQGLGRTKRAA